MITQKELERQLKQTRSTSWFWNKPERRDLRLILAEGEQIILCVDGNYSNGTALLCITDQRILLVDRKPLLYLTVENIPYGSVSEFNLHHQIFWTHLQVAARGQNLRFSSANQAQLRKACEYIQNRVLEIRRQPADYLRTQYETAGVKKPSMITNPYTKIDSRGVYSRLLPALMVVQIAIVSLMFVRFIWNIPSLSSNLLAMASALCAGMLGVVSITASSLRHDSQARRKRHHE